MRIDVKSLTSEMSGSANPRIFALSSSKSKITCCACIDNNGKKVQEWFWPSIKGLNTKEGKEFLDALDKFNPHIVVVQREKFLLQHTKKFVYKHNENWSQKTIVTVIEVAIETAKEVSYLNIV